MWDAGKWVICWPMKSDVMKLKKDYEKAGFVLLFLIMAVYYGYRMFALTPWYDELYTYYYFISRGPVYAAIHWPLPNNHVGYSVLSGFLDYFGNSYIGLRGISYLCALANMALLFHIGRCFFRRGLSLAAVILYISMNLINQLAVQGRGYTLGVTCYLTAFVCLIYLYRDVEEKKRYYIIYAVSLILGLYTLTSDVYWVLPVCFTGGIYLLYRGINEAKENEEKLLQSISIRKLIKLIAASLAAAAVTVGLYTIIWLAIGSNLLVKAENGIYAGMGHMEVILKAPFQAISTGMEYMLATPYIQSVEREGFMGRLGNWFMTLFNWYYDGAAWLIVILILSGIICLIYRIAKGIRKKEKESILLPVFLLVGILCMPLFLIIQCALPYYRVFVYGGVLLALLLVFFIQQAIDAAASLKPEAGGNKAAGIITGAALFTALLVAAVSFGGKGYQNQYSMREYYIQDALARSNIYQAENLCVTDCTQQYLIKFLYDITCENTQIENADMVLLDRKMTDPGYQEMEWEFYHYYDTIPWDYINNSMKKIYENNSFILYEKIND